MTRQRGHHPGERQRLPFVDATLHGDGTWSTAAYLGANPFHKSFDVHLKTIDKAGLLTTADKSVLVDFDPPPGYDPSLATPRPVCNEAPTAGTPATPTRTGTAGPSPTPTRTSTAGPSATATRVVANTPGPSPTAGTPGLRRPIYLPIASGTR